MNVIQTRIPRGLIKRMDALVRKGIYTSRSDVVRDALRRMLYQPTDRVDSIQESKEKTPEQVDTATLGKKTCS